MNKVFFQGGCSANFCVTSPSSSLPVARMFIWKTNKLERKSDKWKHDTNSIFRKIIPEASFSIFAYFLNQFTSIYVNLHFNLRTPYCETEIRFWYQEPKPRVNFSINFGAIFFFPKPKVFVFKFFSFSTSLGNISFYK